MRIIGGEFRGIRIDVPKNFRARPTTDRARESLFNILSNNIVFEAKQVLDLFSGTGSIGLEFVSRGCSKVIMIEKNFIHQQHIVKAIEKLKCRESATAIKSDVFNYIKSCTKQFDIIFADPPYDLKRLKEIPEIVLDSNILRPNGLLIVEHPGEIRFNELNGFSSIRQYGKVHFSFFEKH